MRINIIILLLWAGSISYAATVPKQYSFSLLGEYTSSQDFTGGPLGAGLALDYAWQVGGLGTEYPQLISVPLMINWTPSADGLAPGHMVLRYGLSTRHYLTPVTRGGLYLSYGLLLNQLWIDVMPGRILGHETLLGIGYDLPAREKYSLFFQLNGRYASFGILGVEKSSKYYSLELVVGIRIKRQQAHNEIRLNNADTSPRN